VARGVALAPVNNCGGPVQRRAHPLLLSVDSQEDEPPDLRLASRRADEL
jgi:hypothetical protein